MKRPTAEARAGAGPLFDFALRKEFLRPLDVDPSHRDFLVVAKVRPIAAHGGDGHLHRAYDFTGSFPELSIVGHYFEHPDIRIVR